jgi:hypothetical protein
MKTIEISKEILKGQIMSHIYAALIKPKCRISLEFKYSGFVCWLYIGSELGIMDGRLRVKTVYFEIENKEAYSWFTFPELLESVQCYFNAFNHLEGSRVNILKLENLN